MFTDILSFPHVKLFLTLHRCYSEVFVVLLFLVIGENSTLTTPLDAMIGVCTVTEHCVGVPLTTAFHM